MAPRSSLRAAEYAERSSWSTSPVTRRESRRRALVYRRRAMTLAARRSAISAHHQYADLRPPAGGPTRGIVASQIRCNARRSHRAPLEGSSRTSPGMGGQATTEGRHLGRASVELLERPARRLLTGSRAGRGGGGGSQHGHTCGRSQSPTPPPPSSPTSSPRPRGSPRRGR